MQFDLRLVAYEPFGERICELPQPLYIESGNPLSDTASMRIKYSKHASGSSYLNRPIEVALEVLNPNSREWFEPEGSRYLNIRSEGDGIDAAGVIDYVLPGYAWLLSKISVYPLSKQFLQGQVVDAERFEKDKRDALNKAEDAATKSVGLKDTAPVEYSASAPNGSANKVWIDTKTPSNPILKVYANNAWTASGKPGAQAAGDAAYAAWVEHQQSQGQLRDTQARTKMTKRVFNGRHPGSILAQLIDEARARGERISGLVTNFSQSKDSAGKAWPAFPGNVEVSVGSSLLKLLETFVDAGQLDFRTKKRTLQVFIQGTEMERELNPENTLRYGVHIDEAPDRSTYESVAGEVLFMGDDGLSFTRSNPEAPKPWGVWETSVAQSGVKSEGAGDRLARNVLEESSRQRVERTRSLHFSAGVNGPLPYVHYLPGDYVRAPNSKGTLERQRVRQITLTRDGKTGLVAGNLVLNDRLLEREIRNARTTSALMGGAGSLGGTGGSIGQETYVDLRTPEAPKYLKLNAPGGFVRDLGLQAYVGVEWYWSGRATNGTPMEDGVTSWQIQYRLLQEGTATGPGVHSAWVSAPSTDGSARDTVFGPVSGWNARADAPAIYQVRVRGLAGNGKVSNWSSIATVQVDVDNEPPEKPSTPVARAEGSILWVQWDGKNDQGGDQPADFMYTTLYCAQVPDGAIKDAEGNYDQSFINGLSYLPEGDVVLTEAGSLPVFDKEYHKPFAFKLMALDMFGNESELSDASIPVAPTPLVDDAYIQEQLDYAKQVSEEEQRKLNEKLTLLDAELVTAKETIADVDTKADTAKTAADNASAALAVAEGKIAESASRVNEAKIAAANAETKAQSVEAGLNETIGDLSGLDIKVTGFQSAIATAEGKATDALSKATSAQGVAQDAMTEYDSLRVKLDAALAAKPGLINDSSFELADQWVTGGRVSIIASSVARSGSKVLAFAGESTTTSTSLYGVQEVPVIAGHEYRLTTYVRSTGPLATNQSVAMLVRRLSGGSWSLWANSPITTAASLGMNSDSWRVFQWTWTAPENATVGFGVQSRNQSSAVYFDDFQVVDATAEASLQIAVENAKQKAEAAARDALAAMTAANLAKTAADGKTAITDGINAPSGVGLGVGDIHRQYSSMGSGGQLLREWRWNGDVWVERKISGDIISVLDVGKLSGTFANISQHLKAGSISTDKLLVGVGQNMIPWAPVLAGEVGPHVAYGDSTATVSALNNTSAYPRHLWFTTTTDSSDWRYLGWISSGGQHTNGYGRDFPATPGRTLKFSVGIYAGGTYPGRMPSFRTSIAFRDAMGTWVNTSFGTPMPMSWSLQQYTHEAVVPDGAVSAYLLISLDGPGGVRIIDPDFREMTDGSLIVNGSITGDQVNAQSVAATIGQFVKVQAENVQVTGELASKVVRAADIESRNLFITGNANLSGDTYIKNLAAREIAATTISADNVTVTRSFVAKVVDTMDLRARNLIVTGDASLSGDTYIKNLAAQEIAATKITVDQLTTTGSAVMDTAVANHMWARKIAAQKIQATEIVIGTGGNLIVNGFGELGDSTNWSNFSRNTLDSTSSKIGANATFWTSSRSGLSLDEYVQVVPGRSYAWRLSSMGQNTGQRGYAQVRWYDAALAQVGSEYFISNQVMGTNSWDTFEGQVKAPEEAVSARFTFYGNHPNGTQAEGQWHRWGGFDFRDAADGALIVDGSITTKHLNAQTFDVSRLLRANKIKADQIEVAQIKDAVRVDSQIFNGRLYMGATFQGGEFRTHNSRDRGIAIFPEGMRVTNVSSGRRTFDINSATGEVQITGTFSTGTAGEPGIRMVAAENAYNNNDQGIWFTYDGNPYGWGTSRTSVAGVFTTSSPGSSSTAANIPLQLRGYGKGGLKIWDRMRLDVYNGNQFEIATIGGLLINTIGGFVVDSDGIVRIETTNSTFVGTNAGGVVLGTGGGFSKWTTGTGPNAYIHSNGRLMISSSRSDLKLDQRNYEVDERILDLPVKDWIDKPSYELAKSFEDNPNNFPLTRENQAEYDGAIQMRSRRLVGFIAEEAIEHGAGDLVTYDADGNIQGYDYSKHAALHQPFIKSLWEFKKKYQPMVEELEELLPKLRELTA